LGITGMTPLADVVAASIGERSFTAALLGVFAAMALLLATGGIYGVLAYAVNQRTREIGVRIALGANRAAVLKQIIVDGMRLIVPGVLGGALGALAATRLLTALLFGVTKYDPTTFVTTAAFLIFVGLLACYVPARRAASVDPIVTLRDE
jgi:ABC-type antimicrobial peptide transport system permease subunit